MTFFDKLLFALLCFLATTMTRANRARSDVTMTPSVLDDASSTRHMYPLRRMRCPYRCKCNAYTREVNCAYKKLTDVPRDISASTRRLILTGNRIRHLPNRIFMFLRHLEVLDLSGNNIETIPKRLTRQLRKLTILNLSSNKIETLSPRIFSKLGGLQSLILRNNKLGKLPVDAFAGLSQVAQIDLSANSLQTLELEMFSGLEVLQKLYLDSNRWHCDCLLKKTETGLRKLGVRTGYIICDSPSQLKGQHLRDRPTSSLCGARANDLVYILLGATVGILSILFAVFMCRRRIAPNIDTAESAGSRSLKPRSRSDSLSKTSLIFESDNEGSGSCSPRKVDEKTDLFKTSRELDVDVISLTNHPIYDDFDDVTRLTDVTLVSSSGRTPIGCATSCPNLSECSSQLDSFAQRK